MRKSRFVPALIAAGFMTVAGVHSFAADSTSRFALHGALSQAYGRSDGVTVLGISELGTTDYRTAALQFGYDIGDNDRLVLQFAHERIGEDRVMAFRSDVELDFAFYEHRFSDAFAVRVGRVQIPRGIFNEVRDIGTLLPFYRPPTTFYSETASASETVDGIVLSTNLLRGSSWGIDSDAYFGGWNQLESGSAGALVRTRVENAAGLHVWVQTPLSGLRVGGGVHRLTTRQKTTPTPAPGATPGPPPAAVTVQRNSGQWNLALEGTFGPVVVRGEYARSHSPGVVFTAYYAQVGVKIWRALSVNAQVEDGGLDLTEGRLIGKFGLRHDIALGLNYAFRPNLVVKIEGHDSEGAGVGFPAPKAKYGIASLAVSF
jgi:hypothetical protein